MGNACDRKLVTQADVAPLFDEPISGEKTLEGDAQTCVFDTAGFSSIHISLRPGVGPETVDLVQSGKTNQTVTALGGVGDKAVWDPTLKEVDAVQERDCFARSARSARPQRAPPPTRSAPSAARSSPASWLGTPDAAEAPVRTPVVALEELAEERRGVVRNADNLQVRRLAIELEIQLRPGPAVVPVGERLELTSPPVAAWRSRCA